MFSARSIHQTGLIGVFSSKKSMSKANVELIKKLDSCFSKLETSNSNSLLKKHLTRNVFEKLKCKRTPYGSTLLDCIQSGIENLDSAVGIYAPDPEAYTTFNLIFDPIISDYHSAFSETHPSKRWGEFDSFGDLDPTKEFIQSTRIRCARSLHGFPFNPLLSKRQYKDIEHKISSALSCLEDELDGTYYSLVDLDQITKQKLISDHLLFRRGDRFLQSANAYCFWPAGRGVFYNQNQTFMVWCNEEDHMRIISMQKDGNIGQVYRRLAKAANEIENTLCILRHCHLGYLNFCPTNLGTAIRASVHLRLQTLGENEDLLKKQAEKFNLQVRGTYGEHTKAEGSVYDISNKRRLGLSEYEVIREMYEGIARLIELEKKC